MKHLIIAGSLVLAACTTPTLSAPLQIDAAKAEYSAETAYNLAGNAYLAAEPYLSPTSKVAVKADLATAYTALKAARSAESIGDTATLTAKVQAVEDLYTQVQAITAPVTPK